MTICLEILGQSKDPPAVQKHIKKCFEGIKSTKLIPPGGSTRTYEASIMNSPDGESAPFADNVIVDGPVELWLAQMEKAMVRSINKLLMQAVAGFKGKEGRLGQEDYWPATHHHWLYHVDDRLHACANADYRG